MNKWTKIDIVKDIDGQIDIQEYGDRYRLIVRQIDWQIDDKEREKKES